MHHPLCENFLTVPETLAFYAHEPRALIVVVGMSLSSAHTGMNSEQDLIMPSFARLS